MPECPALVRNQSQPRLFFTLCFLFSIVIVIITAYFLYNPDGLYRTGSHSFDFEQHQRRPGLRSELHGRSRVGDLEVGEDKSMGVIDKNALEENNHEESGQESQPTVTTPRLRHHAHHHGKPALTLEELVQRPLLSNVIELRMLHFDLKGAPPKLSYLKEVLRLAKRAGLNGLLLEWEDTFPWSRSLANLSMVDGGYTREEAEELVNYAELVLDFEVIPLVQTFGHVEFVLKGSEFRHLREVDLDPQSFCPSKPETLQVIKEMIDQTLELHSRSRYLHIGMDEVYNLRVCPLCQSASHFKEDLFIKHVSEVATYVRQKGKIPIIWDDMLRTISFKRLNESELGSLVEPMVWVYAEDVDRFVGWDSWEKYAEIFPTVWGAAAFKGAYGETLSIPPLSRHADNVDRWINVIARESPKWRTGTGGLVLTGWMRYDHFSVLCELLPASVPSLIYNSLQLSIPASTVAPIKNRVFALPNQEFEDTHTSTMASASSSEATQTPTTPPPSSAEVSDPNAVKFTSHISKRSTSYRRKIAHPRILMAKDRIARLVSHNSPGGSTSDNQKEDKYDKFDLISKEFSHILHCPSYHTRIDALLKGTDNELSFASRCNFSGVAFFRSLFRLKPLLKEGWELVEKIQRNRGWVTPYNIRHNYSLPLRVTEVLEEVPRYKRQIEVTVRGIETSLRPIFRQEIILEWIEQNVWEIWKTLRNLERVGDQLRHVNVWPRRPVESPMEMVQDLKLSRVDVDEL